MIQAAAGDGEGYCCVNSSFHAVPLKEAREGAFPAAAGLLDPR